MVFAFPLGVWLKREGLFVLALNRVHPTSSYSALGLEGYAK